MAKFLFVVDVKESGDIDSNYVSGCECKPTTLLEYAKQAIEEESICDISEVLRVILACRKYKGYKTPIDAELEAVGFFSKESIDKATSVRLGNRFYLKAQQLSQPMTADTLELLSTYDLDNMVSVGGEILCSVDENSLPKSVKYKIKEARKIAADKDKRRKIRAAKKEERAKAKKIEEAKRLLSEAGVKV